MEEDLQEFNQVEINQETIEDIQNLSQSSQFIKNSGYVFSLKYDFLQFRYIRLILYIVRMRWTIVMIFLINYFDFNLI